MSSEDKKIGTAKELWWFVIVGGGLLFGLLIILPTNILTDAFLDATNGSWLRPKDHFMTERIARWSNVRFVAEQALIDFAFGTLFGLTMWVLHHIKVSKAIEHNH